MTDPAYGFYQQVRVSPAYPDPQLAGQAGAILGMAQAPEGWTYGVFFDHLGQVVILEEALLDATGRQFAGADFYDDRTWLRVEVDPLSGEGRLL